MINIIKKLKSFYDSKFDFMNLAKLLGFVGLVILIISLVFMGMQYFSFLSPIDPGIASNLGGFISGFVGIFWSGAGVILIYTTFRKQHEYIVKQQFETTFFNLINTYNNLVNTTRGTFIDNEMNNIKYEGREYFSEILQEIKNGLKNTKMLTDLINSDKIPECRELRKEYEEKKISNAQSFEQYALNEAEIDWLIKGYNNNSLSTEFILAQYEYFYRIYQNRLGHYFRYIFRIFKYIIEEKGDNKGEIRHYLNILQAQMSNDELVLIFYNALSQYGKSQSGEYIFQKWLNEYSFLENIDKGSLIYPEDYRHYDIKFKFLYIVEN